MLSVLVNRGILSISWIRALREADQGQSAIGDVLLVLYGRMATSYGQQWMVLAVTGGWLLCLVLA